MRKDFQSWEVKGFDEAELNQQMLTVVRNTKSTSNNLVSQPEFI